MTLNKKYCLLFLVFVVIMLIGVTMVSATGSDTNYTQGVTDNKDTITSGNADVNEIVQNSAEKTKLDTDFETETNDKTNTTTKTITKYANTKKVKQDPEEKSVTNYSDLRTFLTSTEYSELIIRLDTDLTGDGLITINNVIKNLTINGNGKTIDGSSKAFLSAGDINLTLENITVQNCKASNGGVISASNTNLTIVDSTFTSNQATNLGGVLYQSGGETNITNSVFTLNRYTSTNGDGGVIKVVNNGKVTLDNNTFEGNSIGAYTGFILSLTKNSKIVNNYFIDNYCNDNYDTSGLINTLVNEIHDNVYCGNKLSVHCNINFVDYNNQALIGSNQDFDKNVEVIFYRNVYNDTVKNGTVTVTINDQVYNSFNVEDGVVHIIIRNNELSQYYEDYHPYFYVVHFDYRPLDNSYAPDNKNFKLIESDEAEYPEQWLELTIKSNDTVHLGENITIYGEFSRRADPSQVNNEEIYDMEPMPNALIYLQLSGDNIASTYTDSYGRYEFNYTPTRKGIHYFNVVAPAHEIYEEKSARTSANNEETNVIGYSTNITLSANNISLGEEVTISGAVYDPITGENISQSANNLITIRPSGASQTRLRNTIFEYKYTPTQAGNITVTVTYAGRGNYEGSVNITTFEVLPARTNMTIINNESIPVGSRVNISGILHTDNGAVIRNTRVNVSVGDNLIENVTVNANGMYSTSYQIDKIGTYIIRVVYNNTVGYSGSVNVSSVEVVARKTNATILNNESILVGQNITIEGTLTDELGQTVKDTNVYVTFGDKPPIEVTVNGTGQYMLQHPLDTVGTIKITVEYANPTVNYTDCINESAVEVNPRKSNMTILNNETILVGQNVTVTGTLLDELNETIKDTTINITINNKTTEVPVNNQGQYTLQYQLNTIGTYNITIQYNNHTTNYTSSTNQSKVNVTARKTNITILNNESVLVGQKVNISGVVYDELDEVVPGTVITVRVGDHYIFEGVEVDEEGRYELEYETTLIGDYQIRISYLNDSTYYISSFNSSSFTVNHRISNMTINNNGPIRPGSNLTVYGDLHDELGKVIVNTFVNITVGTVKAINVPVDGNGYYEHNFTLHEVGSYDIKVEYTNDTERYASSINTSEYKLDKIPTVTNVTIANNTVYVVAIDVEVKEKDMVFNDTIKEGEVNVTVNGTSKVYPLQGARTRIVLDDVVNVTTTDEIDFRVEFIENNIYLNSTGIDSTNGEEITRFIARPLNSNLTVVVSPNPQNITGNVLISGQVTDELGNIIEEGSVTIEILGKESETITFNGGKYNYNYTTDAVGEIPFNVTYHGEKTANDNMLICESSNSSTFTVDKIPTVTNVTAINSTAGNVTLNISVTGVDGNKSVTGKVFVIIDGNIVVPLDLTGAESYAVNLHDNITRTGNISVQTVFEENDNYYSSMNLTNVTVLNQTPILMVEVGEENVVNSTHVTIRGTLTDDLGNNLSGSFVEIFVNDELAGTVKTDSEGKFSLDYVASKVGENIVNATYSGDNTRYSYSMDSKKFNVYKLNTSIELDVSNIIHAETELINITLNDSLANGVIIVQVNSTVEGFTNMSKSYDINQDTIQIPLNNLNCAEYFVTVIYDGDSRLNGNNTQKSFNVLKAGSNVEVKAENISVTYNETIMVTLLEYEYATGNVSVKIVKDDEEVITYIIEPTQLDSGINKTVIENLEAGEYTVEVLYINDTNYNDSTATTTFTVTVPTITIHSNKTIYINETVTVHGTVNDPNHSSPEGTIILTNKINTTHTLQEYEEGITLTFNESGTYTINATYKINNKVITTSENIQITVQKIPTNTLITILNSTAGNTQIEVTVNNMTGSPLNTGNLTIEYANETFLANKTIENNKTIINIPTENTDTIEIIVTYNENSKYNTSQANITIKPTKQEPTITIQLDKNNITLGENITITGTVHDEMGNTITENTTITINEEEYTPTFTDNGTYTLTITPTQAGTYTTNTTYKGNNTIKPQTSTTLTYNVNKIPTNTTVTILNKTAGNVLIDIKVELEGEDKNKTITGTIKITVNGKTETTELIGTENKTIPLNITTSGNNIITVEYTGNNVYLPSNTTQTINTEKQNTTITVNTNTSQAYIDETITITGKLTTTTGEKLANTDITLTIDETDYLVTTDENGTYQYNYTSTNNKTIEITATFKANTTYEESTNQTTYNVTKIPTNITTQTLDNKYGNVTISINVNDIKQEKVTTGTITIYDDTHETILTQTTITNGKIDQINIPIETAGPATIIIEYQENNKYLKNTTTQTINVEKLNSTITINIAEDNVILGKSVVIYGSVSDSSGKVISSGIVTVLIDNAEFNVTLVDGEYLLNNVTNKAGTFKVNATFNGNTMVNSVTSANVQFSVNKIPTTTAINVNSNELGNVSIDVSVKDYEDKSVFIGKLEISTPTGTFTQDISEERTSITINTTTAGNIAVKVKYLENEKYLESSDDEIIIVNALDTTLTVTAANPVKVGNNVSINGQLTDNKNKAVPNSKVEVKIDNKSVANVTTDSNGRYSLSVAQTVVGTHNVTAVYIGNDKYDGSEAGNNFVVVKLGTKVSFNSINNVFVGENILISGKIVDEYNKAVANAHLRVSFDGTTQNVTCDGNGNYKISFPTSMSGDKEVRTEYLGNNKYESSEVETAVKVLKINASTTITTPVNAKVGQNNKITGKIMDNNGKSITNIPVNVTVNGKTYKTVTDSNGNYEVEPNNIVEGTNNVTVSTGNNNVNPKQTTTKFNATRTKATITLNKVNDTKLGNNVTITGKLVDDTQKPVSNAPVIVTLNNDPYPAITDNNGVYHVLTSDLAEGQNNVTARYEGDEYPAVSTKTTFKAGKSKTIVKVIDIIGTIGEDITLTAYVTDEYGNPVSGGNLVFKMNGRSLREDKRFDTSTAKPLKLKVREGVVTFTIKANLYIRDGKNLTASYSGNSRYVEAKANTAIVNIRKRTAQVQVTVTPTKIRQDTDIIFSAKLTDVTKDATNSTCLTTNAKLLFKLNGVTLKNTDGTPNTINVTQSTINYVYSVPNGMSGMKNYTLEAVYDNPLFYPDVKNKTNFTVIQSKVNINFIKTSVANNILSVKANFTDYEDQYLVGTNNVCVKINGKTYEENGKTKYFKVQNGKVDITNISIAPGTTVKSVMLVTGAREAYTDARATTTDIIFS